MTLLRKKFLILITGLQGQLVRFLIFLAFGGMTPLRPLNAHSDLATRLISARRKLLLLRIAVRTPAQLTMLQVLGEQSLDDPGRAAITLSGRIRVRRWYTHGVRP
jgi:hypothetical protein